MIIALSLFSAGCLSFSAAVFAHGEEVPPEQLHPETQIGLPDAKAGHAHGGGDAHDDAPSEDGHVGGHGESDMSDNFEARLDSSGPYAPQTPLALRISIHEKAAGKQIQSFDVTHEKQLHLIIVSSDLEEFYHVHPIFQSDGTFLLENFSFPRELRYTLFFDLKPTGAGGILLRKDVLVGKGAADPPFLKPSQFPVDVGDFLLDFKSNPTLLTSGGEAQLTFRLRDVKTGALVTDIQPYLAAPAHLVVLSEKSLEYLHMHPLGDIPTDPALLSKMRFGPDIQFAATFPQAGAYKGWLQILRNGTVIALPFIVDVLAGEHMMADGSAMSGDHYGTSQAGLTRDEVAELVHETQKTEESRSVIKFIALTLFIMGMMLLYYPRKPVVIAQTQQPPASPAPPTAANQTTPPQTPTGS